MSSQRFVVRTSLVVSTTVLAACGAGGGSDEAGSIEVGLRSIPLAAYDIASDSADGRVEVLIGDVAAVADAERLADPSPGRDVEDDVIGWTFELGRGNDDDQAELVVPLPQQFSDPSFALAADEELGLDVGAMERFASITAFPFEMLVMTGELELSAQLDVVGNGVSTLGTADDYEIDLDVGRALDLISRPVRLAARDGAVVMSPSTPGVEAWLAGGETLADDEDYLAAARALDASGALGAYFIEGDFDQVTAVDPTLANEVRERVTITERFNLVAVGMTDDDGTPGNAVAYVFSNDADATSAVDGVEAAWTDAELLSFAGSSIGDQFEFTSISVDGAVVTVQVVPANNGDTERILSLLFRTELQFLHS